ncbi:serine protease snake-like [Zophobas morio]|uniref:serine protease snake-like n=1 Tax=Zophobas morio TaxID=2755281 RepID=UPI003082980A
MRKRLLAIISYDIIPLVSISSVLLSNCLTSALFEGENCTVRINHEEGRCIRVDDCQHALKQIRSRINLGACGFKGNDPLVCCPLPSKMEDIPGTLSVTKCMGYDDFLLERLFHGEQVPLHKFSHMAAIGYDKHETDIAWLCRGTLISYNFVLGAAHCAYNQKYKEAQWIRLGALDLKNNTETNRRTVKINEIYTHPNYKYPSYYYDIALFKMDKNYYGYKPACLHPNYNLSHENLQITGWTSGSYSDTNSKKATLSLVDRKTCAKRYKSVAKTRKLKSGILDKIQICASYANTCQGNSGGALHYRVDPKSPRQGHFVIAGITSFGKPCGRKNSIGVYTRVSAFIGWIEDMVWRQNEDNLDFDIDIK